MSAAFALSTDEPGSGFYWAQQSALPEPVTRPSPALAVRVLATPQLRTSYWL
jgi:hypothetical protein